MNDEADNAKMAALAAIVANVKRLLNDARLLQEGGSAGSALSLGPKPNQRVDGVRLS